MSKSELFQVTKMFIEEKPAVAEALMELRQGTSIALLLDGKLEAYCFYSDEKAHLVEGTAPQSDVLFEVSTEAMRQLAALPCDHLAETGIEIVRQIVAGNVKIQLTGPSKNILTKGYLNIIKKAGPDFLNFLAQYGLKNMFKIIATIKKLRQ